MATWKKLPKLTTIRRTVNEKSGKVRKTEVISPAAFSGLRACGIQLMNKLGDLQEEEQEGDYANVQDLVEAAVWPVEDPQKLSVREAFQLVHLFMEHLRVYSTLLNSSNQKAEESEDPRVAETLPEREERAEFIEEFLEEWDGGKHEFGDLLRDDDFQTKFELDTV